MRTFCPYCGIANAHAVSTCFACGTTLVETEAPPSTSTTLPGYAPVHVPHRYPHTPAPPVSPPVAQPIPWPHAQDAGAPPDYWYPPANVGYGYGQQATGPQAPPISYGQLNGRYPALYTPVPQPQPSDAPQPMYQPRYPQYQAPYPQPAAAAYDPFAVQQQYGYGSLAQPGQGDLADVGARLGAMVLDCIALTVPLFMLLIIAAATESATVGSMAALLSVFGPALYFIACWASGGQTLGYRALGLRLVRTDGSQPGVGSAIARFIGVSLCVLMFIPGMIGVLWMLWDYRRQGWHDKMGDTLVVKA